MKQKTHLKKEKERLHSEANNISNVEFIISFILMFRIVKVYQNFNSKYNFNEFY